MSQINLTKSITSQPPSNMRGIGFDPAGNLIIIKEDGAVEIVGGSNGSINNIIANRGVGLFADIPASGLPGDIYVATDTLRAYRADNLGDFVSELLNEKQFITDSNSDPVLLYQYDGTQLLSIKPILFDYDINLSNPAIKTPSGASLTQSEANIEYSDTLKALTNQLARISSASLTFQPESVPVLISNIESIFDIKTENASSNTDILEIDDINNTITFKVAGRYQFLTTSIIQNTTSADRIIYFKTRYISDDTINTQRQATIQKNSVVPLTTLTTFDVIESQLPLTVYPTVTADIANAIYVNSLSAQTTIGGIAASTTDKFVAISATDTTPGYLQQKQTFGNEFESTINNPAGNENILTIFKGWIYNTARTFKARFNLESLTDDRTITWPDKDITVAGIDDVVEVNQQPAILSQYDSSTTMADPGAGKFRINAGKTQLALNYQEPSGSNIKIHANKLSNGSTLKLQVKGDDSKYKNINVTGITDNTTWALIDITVDNEGTAFVLGDVVGLIIVGASVIDYENIMIRDIGEFWGVFRPFTWKIKVGSKVDADGTSTITTSTDVAYTLGDTVTANDYLKVTGDTENMRTSFIIEAV